MVKKEAKLKGFILKQEKKQHLCMLKERPSDREKLTLHKVRTAGVAYLRK